jgi:Fur family transcriptional regulator, peroxide stress response regulator
MDKPTSVETSERVLRHALERRGHRFTEQRAAVYRCLANTAAHPTAEELFFSVRSDVPGISLATVYKSLETLVGCGLAAKLSHSDGSARYDARTDLHYHSRCLACGKVRDVSGRLSETQVAALQKNGGGFRVTGYRLELTGYCPDCSPAAELPAGA